MKRNEKSIPLGAIFVAIILLVLIGSLIVMEFVQEPSFSPTADSKSLRNNKIENPSSDSAFPNVQSAYESPCTFCLDIYISVTNICDRNQELSCYEMANVLFYDCLESNDCEISE